MLEICDGMDDWLDLFLPTSDFWLHECAIYAQYHLRSNLPDGFLERARHLANYHEYGVFTSPQLDGIGNSKHFCLVSWRFCYSERIWRIVAGRTILPSIVNGMNNIANTSHPLKFVYEGISYKPFLSLFNMTGVAQAYPQLAGIGEHSSRSKTVYIY